MWPTLWRNATGLLWCTVKEEEDKYDHSPHFFCPDFEGLAIQGKNFCSRFMPCSLYFDKAKALSTPFLIPLAIDIFYIAIMYSVTIINWESNMLHIALISLLKVHRISSWNVKIRLCRQISWRSNVGWNLCRTWHSMIQLLRSAVDSVNLFVCVWFFCTWSLWYHV